MAKVSQTASSPVDPKSVDPNNTEAWSQAQQQAKDVGIQWERPSDDKRSAQEIIDDTPLLKNLGNQSGVRDSLEQRVNGDITKDADAAYRAAQVLEHIEKYDAEGKRLASNDVNNGEINGFTSKGDAKGNTEAGRLQDFGKYGFSNLKGQLRDLSGTKDISQSREQAEKLGIKWERPKDDTRSAKDILADSPLLRNLGNQSGVKDMLKEQVGDFETDADAAFRANQVLDHIEKFDDKGTRQVGGDVGDHKINGFTGSDEARPNTEAGRLQDFGKEGFSSLDGKLSDYKDAASNTDERDKAKDLGIEWERPKDDTRSAKEIVEGDPLLQELGEHSGVRDLLKERVGDFYNDADAAFRATQVLRHVEQFDGDGKEITKGATDEDGLVESGDTVGNGSIDGFTSSREAKNDTEAGRLQDFGKEGFSALKGNLKDVKRVDGKAEDSDSYKKYLKANPDADEGSKQIAKYAATLESNYDVIREKAGSSGYLDAAALKRYADTAPNLSDETKDALNFWSQPGTFNIIDNAKKSLAQKPDGDLSKGDLQTWLTSSAPKDSTSLMTFMSDAAQRSALSDIDVSKLGKDVFDNPGKYSNEQKAAVLQDLLQAQQLMVDGASAGMWKNDYSQVSIANRARVHPDKDRVFADLNEHIAILQNDKEVTKTLSTKTSEALKDIVDGNKGLKESLQKSYDDSIKTGKALDESWSKNSKEGASQQAILADFVGTAQSFQDALGISNATDIQDAVKASSHNGELKDFYEKSLVSGDRLKDLLKDNSFEKAASVFNMEVALYNSALDPEFTGKLDDKLEENFSKIGSESVLKDASFDDLKKAFGVNGSDELDEAAVKSYIEQVGKDNPELFINEQGQKSTPDQIMAGFRATWDVYRQGTKTLDKSSLTDLNPEGSAKTAYDRGVLHGVSGLVLAGITIARGVGTGGKPTEKDIVNITAGSVQTATVLTEGGMKGYTNYLKNLKGKLDEDLMETVGSLLDNPSTENAAARDAKETKPALYDKRIALAKKFEEGAKGIGGAAGVAMGAYSIFDGVKAIRNGDKVTGGLSITSGSLGAMAGLASMVEGAWGLGNALLPNLISKVPNLIPVMAGALGWAAAGVGVLVSFLPSLIAEGKEQKKSDDFGNLLGTYLTKYEIDGVKNGDIGDIPDDQWPGDDSSAS